MKEMKLGDEKRESSEDINILSLYENLTGQIKKREDVYPTLLEVVTPLDSCLDVLRSLEEVPASSSSPSYTSRNLLFDLKSDFHAHFLSDKTLFISLHFDPNDEKQLAILDNFASTVIRHGGTLRSRSRQSLDAISPYLAKRITGEYSANMQEQIKVLFDPNDVMSSDRMFWVRHNQGKSMITLAKEKNK